MTWGEVQIISLQKMFLNDVVLSEASLATYRADDDYKLYLSNMIPACNEAIQLIASVTKPIIATYEITQEEVVFGDDGYTPTQQYDLNTLTDDNFIKIINVVYSYFDEDTGEYITDHNTTDYKMWGDHTLQLNTNLIGTWVVYYEKKPTKITSSTLDSFEMEFDDNVNVLIPMYVTSQVYKNDNNSKSVMYRNEFESGLDRLDQDLLDNEQEFENLSGWL